MAKNSFLEILNYAQQKPEIVRALAGQLGLNEQQTDHVSQMLISAIAGGMMNNIQKGGMNDLIGALQKGQHETLLEKAKNPHENLFDVVQEGNGILSHVLGKKQVSREIASTVEQKTSIDTAVIKTMLPIIASVVMGLLSQNLKQQGSQNLGNSLTSMLDFDGNGNPLDDILRLASTLR